ncbi:uncharacterized protein LOC142350775 [Convolutriloba macropyga]|uniref:uncharacterized protein LOC142350775 n=1 Tax=Convolutriloba macropyga TaxID=536237 RepID=UPI003F5253E5
MLISIPHFVFLGIFVVFGVKGELKYSSETCQKVFDNEESYTSKAGQELGEDDPFSIVMLCFHNWYREAANLDLFSWNSNMAKVAAAWAAILKKNNNCALFHSHSSTRGENLALIVVEANHLLKTGEKAIKRWFNDSQYYKFGGESESFNTCKMTSDPIRFTQLMWQNTTEIGCGYDLCDEDYFMVVVCHYSPRGNQRGKPMFQDRNFCALNEKMSSLEAPVDAMGTCGDFDGC